MCSYPTLEPLHWLPVFFTGIPPTSFGKQADTSLETHRHIDRKMEYFILTYKIFGMEQVPLSDL